MNVTPTARGSFLAGIVLWLMAWATLLKLDEIAQLFGVERWISTNKCTRWINDHRGTSLLATEMINYGLHGTSPEGVTFAAGGTVVNTLVVLCVMPLLNLARRRKR